MCGGFGTRIKSISKGIPKSLIKFDKKPFIEILLKNISRYNFNNVLLLCYYKGDKFYKKYHNKKINGLKIKCIIEKKPLGTLKSLINSKKFLEDFFLLTNGDTFFDLNILDLYCKFNYKKNLIIFGSTRIKTKEKLRFQNFLIRKNILKKVFYSKSYNQSINTGLGIINKKSLNYVENNFSSFDKDLVKKLSERNKIQVINYNAKFIYIGTPQDLKKFQKNINFFLKKPAVFLDRDGVINYDYGYVHKKKNFHWKKNVKEAIKYLNDRDYFVFIITNQSGIGRGYYSLNDMNNLHLWMQKKLKLEGAHIDEIFFSPYFKYSKNKKFLKDKNLRKPNVGMINIAKKKWNINLNKSYVIGDKDVDKNLARNSNLNYVGVNENSDLLSIVKKITKD